MLQTDYSFDCYNNVIIRLTYSKLLVNLLLHHLLEFDRMIFSPHNNIRFFLEIRNVYIFSTLNEMGKSGCKNLLTHNIYLWQNVINYWRGRLDAERRYQKYGFKILVMKGY